MYDKVVTTERKIRSALSKLIDNDPYKQLCWVEKNEVIDSLLDLRSVGEELYAASDMENDYYENFVPEYLICPIFMIAYVRRVAGDNNIVEKEIDYVDFSNSASGVSACIAIYTAETSIRRNDIHLFMFKDGEGFVEIPFKVGYYIPSVKADQIGVKEAEEQYIDHLSFNNSLKMPYKVYFNENDFVDMSLKEYSWSYKYNMLMNKSDYSTCFFVEIPGVWDVRYFDSWMEPERMVDSVWHGYMNFQDIIEKVVYIMRVRFSELSGPPEVIVKDSWYSYRITYKIKSFDELDFDECSFNTPAGDDNEFISNLRIYATPLFD